MYIEKKTKYNTIIKKIIHIGKQKNGGRTIMEYKTVENQDKTTWFIKKAKNPEFNTNRYTVPSQPKNVTIPNPILLIYEMGE